MKQVKVLKVPVRYKGVTHTPGASFEMEDDHVNESIVEVTGDIGPKSITEMTIAELKKYAEENEIDLGTAKKQKEILDVIQEFEKEKTPDGNGEKDSGGDGEKAPSKE